MGLSGMADDRSGGDDRRGPDNAAIRALMEDMDDLGRRLDRMNRKLEQVSVLTAQVWRNQDDISDLREALTDPKGLSERVAVLEAYMKGAQGEFPAKPAWWAAAISGLGLILLGLWQVAQWAIQLFKGAGK